MAEATPSNVRSVISTDLSDSEIQSYIDDAVFANEQANDTAEMSTEHIRQLEKYLAAFLIRGVRDRALSSGNKESTSLDYDGSALSELRKKIKRLDPSGELAGLRRDSDRFVTSTATAED